MKNFGAISFIALFAVIIVFGPLCTIWAFNTLFSLSIAYTFETWIASIILTSIVSGNGVSASFKK